ncbi:MAG: hypothetical protein JO322_06985, partial [Candidatus Eremiobacteraeota bacterium]|nr:hypothetical protein [Candidatus Eremiobacteraeota bacterium]
LGIFFTPTLFRLCQRWIERGKKPAVTVTTGEIEPEPALAQTHGGPA